MRCRVKSFEINFLIYDNWRRTQWPKISVFRYFEVNWPRLSTLQFIILGAFDRMARECPISRDCPRPGKFSTFVYTDNSNSKFKMAATSHLMWESLWNRSLWNRSLWNTLVFPGNKQAIQRKPRWAQSNQTFKQYHELINCFICRILDTFGIIMLKLFHIVWANIYSHYIHAKKNAALN